MKLLKLTVLLLTCIGLRAEVFFTPQMISSHLADYSDEDVHLINKDLDVIRSVCFEGTCNSDSKVYLATAGAPGARKTTILEKFIFNHPQYKKSVYVDPDPRALKFMVHTYHAQSLSPLVISQGSDYDRVIKEAYNRWRPASNYIALTVLEEAFDQEKSVVHGTTSTGGHLPIFYPNLKEHGYKIVLLLCSCPDDVRYQAVDYRNKNIRFYQSSPEDAVAKGKIFPQRMETYFTYADLMYFYWSDSLTTPEKLAGIWADGKLEVIDANAMQKFIDKYESDRIELERLGKSIPDFDSFL